MKRALRIAFFLVLASCGDTCKTREREITQADLELQVWQQLREPKKYTPPVFCPGPIDARVGADITCWMFIKGERYDVRVTITSIEGTKVEYEVEVADRPREAGAPVTAN